MDVSGASLRVQDVTVGYDARAVAGPWSAEITPGEIVAIVGANGVGKSTLLKVLAGLLRPVCGVVSLGTRCVHSMSERQRSLVVAYVDQQPSMATRLSARAVIELGTWRGGAGVPDATSRVRGVMEELGIEGFQGVPWHELSEGQRHRVAVARALVQCTEGVLALDEPFAALDSTGSVLVARALRRRAHAGVIVLASAHDAGLARALASVVVRLGDGRAPAAGCNALAMGSAEVMLSPEAMTSATGVPHWGLGQVDGSGGVGPDWGRALG